MKLDPYFEIGGFNGKKGHGGGAIGVAEEDKGKKE